MSRVARTRAWVRDMWFAPNPPERNPMIFCLCVVIAILTAPTAVGLKALPGSLADAPDLYGQLTAIGMCGGALISGFGILWINRDTGLALEMAGKILLGFGTLFYCVALFLLSTNSNPMLAASMAGGISVGSFARVIQIAFYVRRRFRAVQTALEELPDDEWGGA